MPVRREATRHELGSTELDLESAAATIGAVCKYREDLERGDLERINRHYRFARAAAVAAEAAPA